MIDRERHALVCDHRRLKLAMVGWVHIIDGTDSNIVNPILERLPILYWWEHRDEQRGILIYKLADNDVPAAAVAAYLNLSGVRAEVIDD